MCGALSEGDRLFIFKNFWNMKTWEEKQKNQIMTES